METTTILDDSAMPAKYVAPEAFAARLLLHDHLYIVRPTDDAIAAAIDAAREPLERSNLPRLDLSRSSPVVEATPVPAPSPALTDGLKTPAQAARRLGISIRTLRGLVGAGELRYVNVGRGKQREKMMFTDPDLDDLIAIRTRQKAQQLCQSTGPKARRTTTSISSGEVLAFTARRNGPTSGKRKR